ncbi:Leucine-rich_repeat domain superfamily [Hexamita inflata]|uniref:Leucine-rich repeat domain superfamily n=1 Tax=Hexamita inflata TaxID=28002 RepID=A0AA86RQD7_9EUKA|nr:Leucine-rich repeat domain superfamily [Hexamita inflata]
MLNTLIYLNLRSNDIINIDALKDQKDIRELYLTHNNIDDFTPFQNNLKKKQYGCSCGPIWMNGVSVSAKNHAYQYTNEKYYDYQYELDDDQLN